MRSLHFSVLLAALTFSCGKPASFSVRESVGQLHVTHAEEGQTLLVVDQSGAEVARGVVDYQGSLVFRRLPPGEGYRVRTEGEDFVTTEPLKVMSVESSKPDPASYAQQELKPGYNYLTMRDGTTLSAWVTMPPGPPGAKYPTVVSYAGYDMARPQGPMNGMEGFCGDFPILCTPPTDASSLLAGFHGYATVSVNIRGTGCSGGAFDYFEDLQLLDGYDVIEIVAAQPWVRNNKVGMVGLSYPGITQLFVGSLRPGLAAIAPMSVIASTETTLIPGGILNDGFALSWVNAVLNGAFPYGQGWEQKRVDEGDDICKDNQLLHSQRVDNVEQARQVTWYVPEEHDRFSPLLKVGDIEVPTFLTGAWHDEQTGPYFHLLFDRFKKVKDIRLTAINGIHPDGFAPQVLIEWYAFLDLFVAKANPVDPVELRNISGFIFSDAFNANGLSLPPARYSHYDTYEEALAAWRAEPHVRVLFESGAGKSDDPGAPQARFEHRFSQWPPEGTASRTLYFHPDGRLLDEAPSVADSASSFRLAPDRGGVGVVAPGKSVWDKLPDYRWQPHAPGDAVVLESEPFAEDTVMLGSASFDLWFNSPVDDADVQVTLSEVRADGVEFYVQSGWLRVSYAKPGPSATEFYPFPTMKEGDWSPLVPGEWRQVRVGTAGFGHAFRAGSRLRATIDTPGGVRADWRFALKTFSDDDVRYAVGHDAAHPSKLVLPIVPGVAVPAGAPPCPSLRGQPCREPPVIANQAWP